MFRRVAEYIKEGLCWKDRLLHDNSEVRYEANHQLKILCDSVTDPKDHRIREFGCLFKDTVNEPCVTVQDKSLDALIAYLKAADADVAGSYANEICAAIVANWLTYGPHTARKAQFVFMLWVELEAVDVVLDAMEKSIKSHVAQALLLALDVMFQALSEFGTTIVPPARLLEMLLVIYDHQDQKVRASSKRLILEICRWIGRDPVMSILFENISDTMKKEWDTELANVTVAAKPTRKIRSERMKKPKWKVAADATRSGPSEESAAKIYKRVDPVNILTPLEKSGFWNKVKSKKWIQRKKALAKLSNLASKKWIAPGEYMELCGILKKLVTDRSIAVRAGAVRAIGNIALGLRIEFSEYSHTLLPLLLAKFSEEMPIMTEALTVTLTAIHKAECVTLDNILKDVKEAVKSEDPHVCSRTLNWVMYCFTSSNRGIILKVYEDYLRICLECLDDGTAQVKDAVFSVLVAIAKAVGLVVMSMSGLLLMNTSLEKLGKLSKAPSEMTIKEIESRLESLVREHSITQLKNAAWKEPLKEQNKKRKRFTGSEHGFRHSVKSVRGEEVVMDEEDDLEGCDCNWYFEQELEEDPDPWCPDWLTNLW